MADTAQGEVFRRATQPMGQHCSIGEKAAFRNGQPPRPSVGRTSAVGGVVKSNLWHLSCRGRKE
jgi:hypothetical protein